MNLKTLYRRHKGSLWPLFALLSLFSIALALAQTPDKKATPMITIDGSQTPDRIPDWILWSEVFKTVSLLSDKFGTKGCDIWVQKLQLSKEQANQLIQHAGTHRAMNSGDNAEVKNLRASTNESKESLRIKLKQAQMNKEVQILELRDALRARIGEEAFQRLQSYAKLNIAPTIKVGAMVRK